MRRLAGRLLRRVRGLLCPPRRRIQQLWSIGIYIGASPWELADPADRRNPVLTRDDVTDVRALFVADPFMVRAHGRWYMFFEVLNERAHRGEIGLATSTDGVRWGYARIVLAEPFHLSYPYVFESTGELYMLPESYPGGATRLYRATSFPTEWELVGTIFPGARVSDATVFRHGELWWLFAETSPDVKHDTLRLYYSESVTGPWREHPHSPIVAGNPYIARPAGRPAVVDGRLIRFAQTCAPRYGLTVRAFEIVELSTETYRERPLAPEPVLSGSGHGWNRDGMHTVDPHRMPDGRWIACVDGWMGVPRLHDPVSLR